MSKAAFPGDKDREERYWRYHDRNLEDFTNLYDLNYKILDLRKNYLDGIKNGTFFFTLPDGRTSSDGTPEIKIRKSIMDFFISGKQLLNNFCKSELLDDGVFKLSAFLLCKDNTVENYLLSTQERFRFKNSYKKIVDIAKDAQHDFKKDFMDLRNSFEHLYAPLIEPFQITVDRGQIRIIEPSYNSTNIFELVEKYYERTLDLIEDMAAYFFGINACVMSKGYMTLFKRKNEVDPSNFKYRYTITLDVGDPDLIRIINCDSTT
ncbi:hypothetical protein [Arcticibacter tournemirensis]